MKWMSIGALAFFGSMACAQVQVTASGILVITAYPSVLPPSIYTHTVTGPTTFTASGVGTATLSLGATSELTLSPATPPWQACPGSCASEVRGNVVVSYTSPVALPGVMRLTLVPACWMQPSTIDLEDDGVLELNGGGPMTVDVPVVLTPNPTNVRLFGAPANFSGFSVACNDIQRIEFLPQPSALTTLLPACGPILGGTLTNAVNVGWRNLRVHIANTVGLLGVLQLGTAPPPMPGVCGPATLPDATVILVPGPNGIEFDLPIPVGLTGTFTLQFIDVSLAPVFQIDWSNGMVLSI